MSILVGFIYFMVTLVVAMVLTFALVAIRNYIVANKEKVVSAVKLFLVAVAVVTILLLAMAIIPPLARADEKIPWQHAEANGSIEVTIKGKTQYFVVFTTDNGEVLSYFGDTEIVKGTRLRVKISPYGETLDAEVEEPDVFWFSPIMFLGAVAPIVRKKKVTIKQKMHPDFFMTKEKYEKDAKQHIAIDITDSRTFVFVYNPDRTKQVFAIPSGVEKAISEATRINPAAFVTTFVPAYGHQAVVFCNYHEHLGAWLNTSYSEKINEARRLLTSPVQIVNEEVDVIKVIYSKNGRSYRFYPIAKHKIGDFCCVEKINEYGDVTYKNVQVVSVEKETKSSIETFCKSKHIKDLSKEYCRYAIDFPGAWADWGGSDPRISTDEEPQDYDFESDFFAPSLEEIAEFQAMRDVYGYHLP